MAYSYEEILELKPMKYWSLPANSSVAQKKKFADAFLKGYTATLKRDGAWYRAGINENIVLQSRTTSVKTGEFVEKQDRVPAIIAELAKLPKQTILIGEICFPLSYGNTISSDVITIMGCNADKAISRQEQTPLNYYIFDILMYDGEPFYNKPYTKRLEKIMEIKKNYPDVQRLEFPEPVKVNIEETIQNFLDNGWEGGVLMKDTGLYEFDKRPAWLAIKIKQSMEPLDLVIMGSTPPVKEYTGKYPASHMYWENNRTGELVEGNYFNKGGYSAVSSTYFFSLIGGFQLGAYYGDNLIEVGRVSNLTDEIREDATNNMDKYIGQVVQVDGMMLDVERKSIRHARLTRFRPDKNASDCLYREIFG